MNKKAKDILKTTAELIKRKSFNDITVKEICAEAGVALGTFYKYFKSKNDLVPSMYDYLDEHLIRNEEKITSRSSVEGQINQFIEEFVTYIVQWGHDANSLILHNSVVDNPKPNRYMELLLERILREGKDQLNIDPLKAQYLILSILRGGLVLWNSNGENFDVEDIIILNGKIVSKAITNTQ